MALSVSTRAPAAAACLLLAGCGTLVRLNAVPVEQQEQAEIADLPEARYWGDGDPTAFQKAMITSFFREQALRSPAERGQPLPPAEFLAISGGGENGAFGAGLLVGWTAAGTRPQFRGSPGSAPAP
ncbi:hypothetical protein [Geminicoccus roseus]|uniref:hypothetical protein n=1 Tax=Geminicoccus roseus TaxID=404900 RepID=UPI0003F76EC3|nr:hypothetical protein [Geminicoccus roseus]